MDKMIKTVIKDKTIFLNYSISVMFDMTDKYKNIQNALDIMDGENKEAFEAVRFFAIKMQNDAELCRRSQGYDKGPMLSESDISLHISPLNYAKIKAAVIEAITQGYKGEIDPDEEEEIDLGLAELAQKKTKE